MQRYRALILLLSSVIFTVYTEKTSVTGITQVLLKLNAECKINLNIFINLKDISKDTLDFKQLETPAIHIQPSINTFNKFSILGNFTEKTLTIVNIISPPLDPIVRNILPYLLKKLHELHIVFITDKDPTTWQDDLHIYCFGKGFINTLLIHHQNRSLSFYSYNPYPVIQTTKLPQLPDYLNRWKLLHNLHHFQIRTVTISVPPRQMHYVNKKGELVHAGYMFHAIKEFTRRHNATMKILLNLTKLTVDDVTALMSRRDIDIACSPMELKWDVPFTSSLYLLKGYIIAPHARPIKRYLYFARPFTWNLWLAVIVSAGYGIVMLYISYGSDRLEIGVQFLRCWCHLLFLPQPYFAVNNWQQFLIHLILILSGFIFTNLYLALLESMLTSGLFENQYNTLQDLEHAPYQLLTNEYYAAYDKEASAIPATLLDNAQIVSVEDLDNTRDSLNTSYMYITFEDKMEALLYQQHLLKVPRLKMIPESIKDAMMSWPVLPSLPYLNLMNSYLRRIFECGILAKMKSDAWRDAIDGGIYKLFQNDGTETIPFDLKFYFFAFVVWITGLALSGLSFLLELLRLRMA